MDDRTRVVRACMEKWARLEYRYPDRDCAAAALSVARAIDPSVRFPVYPTGTQERAYKAILAAGGLVAWAVANLPENHGFSFGPEVIRPGDIFLQDDDAHPLKGWIGVFDPAHVPMAFGSDGWEAVKAWPERVWTYG